MTRAYQYSLAYAKGEIDFQEYKRLMIPVLNGRVKNRIEDAIQLTLWN